MQSATRNIALVVRCSGAATALARRGGANERVSKWRRDALPHAKNSARFAFAEKRANRVSCVSRYLHPFPRRQLCHVRRSSTPSRPTFALWRHSIRLSLSRSSRRNLHMRKGGRSAPRARDRVDVTSSWLRVASCLWTDCNTRLCRAQSNRHSLPRRTPRRPNCTPPHIRVSIAYRARVAKCWYPHRIFPLFVRTCYHFRNHRRSERVHLAATCKIATYYVITTYSLNTKLTYT